MGVRVLFFAVATLAPVPLLVAGAFSGGVWIWAALVYLSLFAMALDEMLALVLEPGEPGREFPAANGLSVVLAVLHFPLLGLAVWALSGEVLGVADKIAGFFAFGLFFGQVSNSNAHELIHRPRRGLRRLGAAVFTSLLFGHHASAHPLVHHVHVATARDPNTARLGQGFYRFAPRAWIGSFRAGLRAENARRGWGGPWLHPYVGYLGGAAACILASLWIGGFWGVLALIGLAGHATAQLLLSDYVQHYGLVRAIGADGRPEPVGAGHSWNAPQWFSGLLMLNAPRHSDHHAHPGRVYPGLVIPGGAPTLPRSLPVMGFVALFPRRWRALMDRRVAALGK